MSRLLVIALVVLGAVLWLLLDRHERRRAANGKLRHSGLRLIPAAAALLTMLFAAGFALLLLTSSADAAPGVIVIAGPPFLAGLFIWWLAMRRKSG